MKDFADLERVSLTRALLELEKYWDKQRPNEVSEVAKILWFISTHLFWFMNVYLAFYDESTKFHFFPKFT